MVTKNSWILPSLDFFCPQGLFWEFLHPLHPPNFNQINRKMTPAVCSEIPPGISSTIFWYPWPFLKFRWVFPNQSISSKWLSEAVIRHLPGENYHPSFSLVFGCFEKHIPKTWGFLQRDPFKCWCVAIFIKTSSNRNLPQEVFSFRNFGFVKLVQKTSRQKTRSLLKSENWNHGPKCQ